MKTRQCNDGGREGEEREGIPEFGRILAMQGAFGEGIVSAGVIVMVMVIKVLSIKWSKSS